MAGQGKSIGHTFEQLAIILDQINDKQRIGICFDTCHTFAAGYDLTTPEGYEKTLTQFNNTIGLKYLKAFHVNDSKKPLNSHVDRHENIGEGLISLQAFEMILNDSRFQHTPKILETPHAEDLENDKKNLQKLLNLIK
jgi:deoxyribonuclease-4